MTVSPEIVTPPTVSPISLSRGNAGIEFDRVSFEYLPGQPILNNLSFSVPPGQSYAIVGGIIALLCIALHCIVSNCIVEYCGVLYRIVLLHSDHIV